MDQIPRVRATIFASPAATTARVIAIPAQSWTYTLRCVDLLQPKPVPLPVVSAATTTATTNNNKVVNFDNKRYGDSHYNNNNNNNNNNNDSVGKDV